MMVVPAKTTTRSPVLLYLLFFSLGGFALLTQTLLLKETFVVALGNEFSIGMVFCIWLVGIFLGGILGSRISDRIRFPLAWIRRLTALLFILAVLSVFLTRIMHHLTATAGGGQYIPFFKLMILSSALIVPIGTVIGLLFPLGSRLVQDRSVRRLTGVYIFEALGSMGFGILYTFVIPQTLNHFLILALFSLPLVIVLLLLTRTRSGGSICGLLVFLALNLALLVPPINRLLDSVSTELRWRAISDSRLVEHAQSRYQDIAVGRRNDVYLMYLNGKLTRTFPEEYHNLITATLLFTQHQNPERFLIIGDPAFELARELSRFKSLVIHSVVRDRLKVEMERKYLPDTTPPGHRVFITDYRLFLENQPGEKYDLIYIDTPNPSTLLNNRSYTVNFFRRMKELLTTDGIIALNLHDLENYYQGLRGHYNAVIYQTLQQVFPQVLVTSGYRRMVFGSPGETNLSGSLVELKARLARSQHPQASLFYLLGDFYDTDQMADISRQLSRRKIRSINSNRHPISVFLFNQIEGWYSNVNMETFYESFSRLKLRYPAGIILLLVLLALGITRSRKTPVPLRRGLSRGSLYLAIFFTGLTSISLHLLLIYRFQNSIGFTYQMIGFLSALFMAGLPVGTVLSNRLIERLPRLHPAVILALWQLGMVLVAFLINFTSRWDLTYSLDLFLILGLILVLGLITGTLYPPYSSLLLKEGKKIGSVSGSFYAFDHLGASFGSFFLSIFLLSLYGFGPSCNVISLLLLFSILLILTTHPSISKDQNSR